MGLGDQLMATGMARGARDRGKKIAFGDGKRIIWDHNSEQVFRGNPNIAPPGSEKSKDLEWIAYYKGHRIYNQQVGARWKWNMDFRPIPGEMFLEQREKEQGERYGEGFVLVEPNIEWWKSVAKNKDWGRGKYQQTVDSLKSDGFRVAQFVYEKSGEPLVGVEPLKTKSFRDALAIMSHAAVYIGPEGGLHHGAAAMGIPAVVLFGGFIPPSVTGYEGHTNLTGGADACGSLVPCRHCREAMARIAVDHVVSAARKYLW